MVSMVFGGMGYGWKKDAGSDMKEEFNLFLSLHR